MPAARRPGWDGCWAYPSWPCRPPALRCRSRSDPTQVDKLRRSQAGPVGHQYPGWRGGGRIAVAVSFATSASVRYWRVPFGRRSGVGPRPRRRMGRRPRRPATATDVGTFRRGTNCTSRKFLRTDSTTSPGTERRRRGRAFEREKGAMPAWPGRSKVACEWHAYLAQSRLLSPRALHPSHRCLQFVTLPTGLAHVTLPLLRG